MFTIDTFNLGSHLGEKSGLEGLDGTRSLARHLCPETAAGWEQCGLGGRDVINRNNVALRNRIMRVRRGTNAGLFRPRGEVC